MSTGFGSEGERSVGFGSGGGERAVLGGIQGETNGLNDPIGLAKRAGGGREGVRGETRGQDVLVGMRW